VIFLVTDNNSVLRLLFLAFSYAHAKSSPSGSCMAMLRESETTQLKKTGIMSLKHLHLRILEVHQLLRVSVCSVQLLYQKP
jgi:hypothetical protein